jgi:hypothetical protein
MPRKKTKDDLIAEFHEVHGDLYDYSLVEYVNTSTKVKVICPKHGVFKIAPSHHKNGVGCAKCYFDSRKVSKDLFLKRSSDHFGKRYDYSMFDELPGLGEKVPIYCREHDKVFFQNPRNHMRGHTGCNECRVNKLSGPSHAKGQFKPRQYLKERFTAKAINQHGDIYDYSQFDYINTNTKGKIICPKHGPFWQSPNNHLRGTKCPKCAKKIAYSKSFKQQCCDAGVDYWRALKRREANLSEEKIFDDNFIRNSREINEIIVNGVKYPNLEEAVRILKPPASSATINRWIRDGMSPEEAFARVPNPGYSKGVIYLITHIPDGKQYVGLTVQSLERRWQYHIEQSSSSNIKSDQSLHAAIREFGPSCFFVQQIDQGTTKDDLESKERNWIEKLNTIAPQGYNISPGGVSGGANGRPVVIDEIRFDTVKLAAEYVAETRDVSIVAAKRRIAKNRIDVRKPAKPGESLVGTQAYKVWSRIVHGVLNPKSKDYISGVELHDRWHDFRNFLKDVGQPPKAGMAFARKDKTKGFYPDNCEWMTKSKASRINAAYMKKHGLFRRK